MHLIWFRHDLRIEDNFAFMGAMEAHQPCVAVYFHCPKQWQLHNEGPLRHWFHLQHLLQLFEKLKAMKIQCIFAEVDDFEAVPDALDKIVKERQISHCWFNKQYGFWEAQRDDAVRRRLDTLQVGWTDFDDEVILPPAAISKDNGEPYKVFTPFKKAWLAIDKESQNRNASYKPVDHSVETHKIPTQAALDDLAQVIQNLESQLDGQQEYWQIGAEAAHELLDTFLNGSVRNYSVRDYHQQRDFPAKNATSSLSPYLSSGVLSPRHVYRQANQLRSAEGRNTWISELVWRDFYRHIMVQFPQVAKGMCFSPEYESFQWSQSEKNWQAWCEGKTGVPLVDAGMRQLLTTGWMHNRVRMVVAMYLTKNLLISWRQGEAFFMQHLVDGDYASNNGGWQWSASVGTDAAPYFRIFNPLTQAERFDPDCEYIYRYVPELRGADSKWILKADRYQKELVDHGYCKLIVDLKSSRQQAIDSFKAFKA